MSSGNKSKIVEKYLSWSKSKKELFWIGAIDFIVFVILIPFFTIGWLKLSLGWILGSIASIVSAILTNYSAKMVINVDNDKKGGTLYSLLFFFARFFVWAIVLVISGICTFKSAWFNGFDLFYFWTAFAAYFPGLIVLLVSNLKARNSENGGQSK